MLPLRYLSIIALAFWMGGFTFYAGVVIHVGHHVFGSAREVGFLTKEVTLWLNRSGVIALAILSVNLFALRKARRVTFVGAAATLLIMIAIQAALFQRHDGLDELLNVSQQSISNRAVFRHRHNIYMTLSTIQWAAALLHLWAVLAAWSSRGEVQSTKSAPAIAAEGVKT
jgi:hypothetical protein